MPRFEITMKPTGMSRAKFRPEYMLSLVEKDRDSAAVVARAAADAEGFRGYAVTSVKEVCSAAKQYEDAVRIEAMERRTAA